MTCIILRLYNCSPWLCCQLETLQSDYNQLKSEYDTLLALHQNRSMKTTGHDVKIIQVLYIHFNNYSSSVCKGILNNLLEVIFIDLSLCLFICLDSR